MNKILLLLSVVALTSASTCYFNGTDVSGSCVLGNTNCTWTNPGLWTNCNSYPGFNGTDSAVVIIGTTVFNLTIDVALSLSTLTIQGGNALATIYLDQPLVVGGIDINNGIVYVNADITINANSTIAIASSLYWTNGDINWTPESSGYVSVEANGALYVLAGTKSANQNIQVAEQGTITFDTTSILNMVGGSIISNGTANLIGNVQITGTNGSEIESFGSFNIESTAAPGVVALALQTTIWNELILANTTLTVSNVFFAQNLTVESSANLNVVVTDNSPISFSSFDFVNHGIVSWTQGAAFTITSNTGSFANYGTFTMGSANGILTCFGSTIDNWGNLIVSAASTIQGDILNKGNLTINANTYFDNKGTTFSTITLDGSAFTGTGNASMRSNVNFFAGVFDVPSWVYGTLTIAQNDTKIIGYNINATVMNISTTVQLSVPFVNIAGNSIYGQNAAFVPAVENDTSLTFVNNGNMAGEFSFNLINFTNNNVMGSSDAATVLSFTDSYLTLTNSSQLVIGINSQTTSPVTVSKSNRNIGSSGASLDGTLLVVLLEGFNPKNGNLTLVSVNGIAPVTGNFTTLDVTAVENANTYNCDYNNTAINYATTEIVLQFEHCQDLPDVASSGSGPNRNTIIIIVVVVVVVVVIAAIVGVVLYRRRNAAHHPSEKQRLI